MTNEDSFQQFFQTFSAIVTDVADIIPNTSDDPALHVRLRVHCERLSRLVSVAAHTKQEGNGFSDQMELLSAALRRLGEIRDQIETDLLLDRPLFAPFDDLRFFERVRSLPAKELADLLRKITHRSDQTGKLDRLVQGTLLADLAVPANAFAAGPVVIGFKIICILIMLLVAIGYPPLVPLLLAIVAVLAEIDKAGGGNGKGGGASVPSAPITPTISKPEACCLVEVIILGATTNVPGPWVLNVTVDGAASFDVRYRDGRFNIPDKNRRTVFTSAGCGSGSFDINVLATMPGSAGDSGATLEAISYTCGIPIAEIVVKVPVHARGAITATQLAMIECRFQVKSACDTPAN